MSEPAKFHAVAAFASDLVAQGRVVSQIHMVEGYDAPDEWETWGGLTVGIYPGSEFDGVVLTTGERVTLPTSEF